MSISTLILVVIFEFTALYGLLLLPFKGQYKKSPQCMVISIGICFICLFAGSFFLSDQPDFISSHFRIIFSIVSSLILLSFLVKAPLWARLFNLFLVLCITGDTFFFVWLLGRMISVLWSLNSITFTYLYLYCLVYLIAMPASIVFMKKLVGPFLKIEEPINYLNKFWILPFSFFILYYIFQSVIITNAPSNVSPVSDYLIFIGHLSWTMGTFLSCAMLMQMLHEWLNVHTYQSKLDTTALHLRMQRREYERLVETINNTRKLRHDMRHHMALINSLAKKGDTSEVISYTQDYLRTSGLEEATLVCENHMINVLVQYYISLAQKYDIKVETKLSLPAHIHIPESDLASIIGNLLENAVDGCRQQIDSNRNIKIAGEMVQGNMIAITVKNTYGGKIERQGDAFISSKRPHHQEGIGISSIRSIAERYGGMTRFKYDEKIFEASVLLNQE